MAHVSVLGLVFLVCCSMLQQMDVEAKARATEEDRMNTTTCMPGTCDKKSSSTTKWPCSSPPKFLAIHGADTNKSSVYTLEPWWCCWRPKDSLLACACENLTSSVNFLLSEKASLSKWSEIKVLLIEKISIASLKDIVVLTWFSRDVHDGKKKMKYQRAGNS